MDPLSLLGNRIPCCDLFFVSISYCFFLCFFNSSVYFPSSISDVTSNLTHPCTLSCAVKKPLGKVIWDALMLLSSCFYSSVCILWIFEFFYFESVLVMQLLYMLSFLQPLRCWRIPLSAEVHGKFTNNLLHQFQQKGERAYESSYGSRTGTHNVINLKISTSRRPTNQMLKDLA